MIRLHNLYLKMNWTELLSGTALGALITQIGKITQVYMLKKASRKYFDQTGELYEILTGVLNHTNIDRWSVYMIHNGGQPLNLLTSSYVTILWEDFDKGLSTQKPYFQKFPMDKSFYELFRDAYKGGSSVAEIKNLDPKTIIYSSMVLVKMKHKQIYFGIETKKGLYFMSFSSTQKDYVELSVDEKAIIQLAVERTRSLFSRNGKSL